MKLKNILPFIDNKIFEVLRLWEAVTRTFSKVATGLIDRSTLHFKEIGRLDPSIDPKFIFGLPNGKPNVREGIRNQWVIKFYSDGAVVTIYDRHDEKWFIGSAPSTLSEYKDLMSRVNNIVKSNEKYIAVEV